MNLNSDCERTIRLLQETVGMLCKNSVHFNAELKVQGLLAITVDAVKIFAVQINDIYEFSSIETSGQTPGKKRPANSPGFAVPPPQKRMLALPPPHAVVSPSSRMPGGPSNSFAQPENKMLASPGRAQNNQMAVVLRSPQSATNARGRGMASNRRPARFMGSVRGMNAARGRGMMMMANRGTRQPQMMRGGIAGRGRQLFGGPVGAVRKAHGSGLVRMSRPRGRGGVMSHSMVGSQTASSMQASPAGMRSGQNASSGLRGGTLRSRGGPLRGRGGPLRGRGSGTPRSFISSSVASSDFKPDVSSGPESANSNVSGCTALVVRNTSTALVPSPSKGIQSPSMAIRSPSMGIRSPSMAIRSPSTIMRPASAKIRSPSAMMRSPTGMRPTGMRPASAVMQSTSGKMRPPPAKMMPPNAVIRSPSTVLRSPSNPIANRPRGNVVSPTRPRPPAQLNQMPSPIHSSNVRMPNAMQNRSPMPGGIVQQNQGVTSAIVSTSSLGSPRPNMLQMPSLSFQHSLGSTNSPQSFNLNLTNAKQILPSPGVQISSHLPANSAPNSPAQLGVAPSSQKVTNVHRSLFGSDQTPSSPQQMIRHQINQSLNAVRQATSLCTTPVASPNRTNSSATTNPLRLNTPIKFEPPVSISSPSSLSAQQQAFLLETMKRAKSKQTTSNVIQTSTNPQILTSQSVHVSSQQPGSNSFIPINLCNSPLRQFSLPPQSGFQVLGQPQYSSQSPGGLQLVQVQLPVQPQQSFFPLQIPQFMTPQPIVIPLSPAAPKPIEIVPIGSPAPATSSWRESQQQAHQQPMVQIPHQQQQPRQMNTQVQQQHPQQQPNLQILQQHQQPKTQISMQQGQQQRQPKGQISGQQQLQQQPKGQIFRAATTAATATIKCSADFRAATTTAATTIKCSADFNAATTTTTEGAATTTAAAATKGADFSATTRAATTKGKGADFRAATTTAATATEGTNFNAAAAAAATKRAATTAAATKIDCSAADFTTATTTAVTTTTLATAATADATAADDATKTTTTTNSTASEAATSEFRSDAPSQEGSKTAQRLFIARQEIFLCRSCRPRSLRPAAGCKTEGSSSRNQPASSG